MAELYYRKFFRERGRWPKALTSAAHALHEGDAWGALAQYIMLAEQGNTAAALNVGWMLRHGQVRLQQHHQHLQQQQSNIKAATRLPKE